MKKLKIIFITTSFLLSSCGFTPVYSNRTSLYETLPSIKVEKIEGENGYKLKAKIEDALNPLAEQVQEQYKLLITLNQATSPLAIQRNSYTTRYNVTIIAFYKLMDSASKIVDEGMVEMISSYDANQISDESEFETTAPFANFVSEENAVNNNIIEIAEELKRRLILTLQI